MNILVNQELSDLNIDILTKAGMKKSTVNKLHKLKVKKLGDLSALDTVEIDVLLSKNEDVGVDQLKEFLDYELIRFTRMIFSIIRTDATYDMVVLHIKNHTHQEISLRTGISKEKVKEKIAVFLRNLFPIVDAVGNKFIDSQNNVALEAIESVTDSEQDYQVLALAFKAHDTKWVYNTSKNVFCKK